MKFPLNQKQTKKFHFEVKECKETTRNEIPVGVIEGFASTTETDRGNDIVAPGAFAKTIERHKRDGRPIRMLRQHTDSKLIGGFPIDRVEERENGLFVVGEVNLAVQEGREAFALAKQGVLTDMSIGFSFTSIEDFEREEIDGEMIRVIRNLDLWEISLVNEPMNAGANITAVKTVTPFMDLPMASRDRPWDSGQAIARVRAFTGSEDEPTERYKEAFLWYDAENADEFGAYKLPFADVVDGRLVAVPRGIFAAAAAMRGARGGVDIPESDRAGVRSHIERYYNKMDLPSPFSQERGMDRNFLDICESVGDVEEYLKFWDMSVKDRNKLISVIKSLDIRDEDSETDDDADRDDDVSLKALSEKLEKLNQNIVLNSINSKLTKL